MRSVLVLIGLVLGGFLRPAHTVWAQAPAASGTIITIAGNGTLGFAGDGGQATDASFNGPQATTVGPDGTLYIVGQPELSHPRGRSDDWHHLDRRRQRITPIVEDGPNGDGGPATRRKSATPFPLPSTARRTLFTSRTMVWPRPPGKPVDRHHREFRRQGHVRQRARLAGWR